MQENRKRIIEMVKEGKLTTEEALVLLDSIQNKRQTEDQKESEKIEHTTYFEEQAQNTNESSEEKFSSQFNEAKDKIMDFVNSAMKKIKDIDLQFNQSVEFPHVFQQANATVSTIDIDVANGHVEVKAWDQPDIRVECQAKVYRKDNRDEARVFFIDNSSFYLENGLLRFSTQSKWMKVDTVVYVPRSTYDKASIRAFNGNVLGESLEVTDLRAKTANGKIHLKQVDTDKVDMETANGKILIQESKANRLTAETMHGSIDVEGKYHMVDLQTLNGNLSCVLNSNETDTLHMKAVSGNIHVYVSDDLMIEGQCKSNLGNVKVQLENMDVLEEKKEVMLKQLRFKRSGLTEKPLHLFAETRTGTVYVQKNELEETKEEKE
ncbi:DUF4097 family beta strand repeat-containing protein [Heyndrickxia oleronia]|uniref:DUF4097 family beta strand repeat-containing protein n=1 Tax=Heyndrickxia oleronia TaxID=38875 RepID=UPI00203D7A37|nr:DUF4097 domain-containing protein [Heyndrickxia oleronia]MCM3238272.1 DUF4097 family beta strand repeat-containing protein [Heyndrickxia oleronia]